jgi:hypothetical protein
MMPGSVEIARAMLALVFPFIGMSTSFISIARGQCYSMCVATQTILNKDYTDNIRNALHNSLENGAW